MKTTKTTFRIFTIFQYEEEQEYLSKMHRKGWELKGITIPGFYHFRKCTPDEYVYQLDYNQAGIDNLEYLQMFKDCGWEYLYDLAGYSYFRKPVAKMQGKEEIFCDDESRLDMMKRVLRGRLIPVIVIFLCTVLPNSVKEIGRISGGDTEFMWMTILLLVLLAIYLWIFIYSCICYFRIKKKLSR